MRNTFRILFIANKSKEKEGMVPLLCRVTVDGTVAQFSCKLSVLLKNWDQKSGRVNGKGRQTGQINELLGGIRSRIIMIYHELSFRGEIRTAERIKEVFLGKSKCGETILSAMRKQIGSFTTRVGKDRALSTLWKYRIVCHHVSEFINWKYGRKDIFLEELDEAFLRDFCAYLSDKVGLSQSSVWVYQMPLRTIATAAFNEGIIGRNPFARFHVIPQVKERQFLTEKKLKKLMDYPCRSHRGLATSYIRDMFVFSCFTGLSYIDLKKLRANDITELNGNLWIISKRQKTGVNYQAKLLPESMDIIRKYGNTTAGMPLFEVPTYCTMNKRLKKLGRESGVCDNLTFHMARHTFATLALSKGMSMESLKLVLGHSDIKTTQIYAKITSARLEKDYACLSGGF